jgi:SAM-dependent methyltransferase
VTAAQDADGWDIYWESGRRDLGILLSVGTGAGPLGTGLVVDLGCGIGRLTRPLSEKFNQVLAVDISGEMLAMARKNVPGDHVDFALVGADCGLDVPNCAADVVLAWTVFRHTPKSVFVRYLSEAWRVLKPGGRLLFEAQIRDSGNLANPPEYQPVTEREYSKEELRSCCSRAGFLWMAEMVAPSATPNTATLIVAWQKFASSFGPVT